MRVRGFERPRAMETYRRQLERDGMRAVRLTSRLFARGNNLYWKPPAGVELGASTLCDAPVSQWSLRAIPRERIASAFDQWVKWEDGMVALRDLQVRMLNGEIHARNFLLDSGEFPAAEIQFPFENKNRPNSGRIAHRQQELSTLIRDLEWHHSLREQYSKGAQEWGGFRNQSASYKEALAEYDKEKNPSEKKKKLRVARERVLRAYQLELRLCNLYRVVIKGRNADAIRRGIQNLRAKLRENS